MELTPSETGWIKFGRIKQMSFVGKDTICLGSGCHLVFINVTTNEEALYHADDKESGEGVRTVSGHKALSFFAFAEKCRFPRVFIMSCPDFDKVCILNKGTNEDYSAMTFTDGEYIVTLNDMPSFLIIVWNWRTGQRIASLKSDIYGKYQLLKCNLSVPIYFAQLQTGHIKLNLWDIAICGKKCVLTPHRISPPDNAGIFSDILWTSEGALFVLDLLGHAYSLDLTNTLIRVIEWKGKGNTVTSFTWYKAGLTIAGPDGIIKHFKKLGAWSCDWQVIPAVPMKRIISNYRDILIGVSEEAEIAIHNFTENNFQYIKKCESKFNDLCLIYPAGEYFVTLQYNREVALWEVATGIRKDVKVLKGKVLAIKENPEYPYVGVAYEHGVLELLSVFDPNEITRMTSFNLSKKPLNNVYFTEIGKIIVAANMDCGEFYIIEGIPGSRMQILSSVEAHSQICDYILIASRTCMRLFALFCTSDTFVAGNKIVRFCVIRDKPGVACKTYQLEYSYQMYSKLYATTKEHRDRVFYAMPLTTKCIHELTTKRGDPYAKVTDVIRTDHQMKKILLHVDKYHAITYAYDGLVIIKSADFSKKIALVMPHYRTYGGVLKAYVDPTTKYVVSLGRDNALVGTTLTTVKVDTNLQEELKEVMTSSRFITLFKRPTIGFCPKGDLKGITWFEKENILQERLEYEASANEKSSILEEFKQIQEEVQDLLTQNIHGPENEILDVQQFNLDTFRKNERIKESEEDCKYTKIYLEALIIARDKISKWIKIFCWDKMQVQGQIISAMFANFNVTNYVLLPPEDKLIKFWRTITVDRKLECQMAEYDIFEPWEPKSESQLRLELERPPTIAEDEKGATLGFLEEEQPEEILDPDTDTAFKGSVTHLFVELSPGHYTQQQICTYLQTQSETAYGLIEEYKLKEAFNKQFEDVMNQKVREMSLTHERIARLRHILSELNYFSVNKIDITIDDPLWSPLENPESILRVEKNEVGITPYISPSEQAILDAIAAEEERIRLLLLADDFRERALMTMMNGVLEVRWEDELRKDVPKPKCMIDKEPEEYNEDDIRAVMQYEEDVKFLNSERERYKKILEGEYGKLSNNVRDGIKKYNKRLADFLLTKIQTDSAVRQEDFRMERMRLKNLKRALSNKREKEILMELDYNHSEVEAIHSLISSLQGALQELKDEAENLQAKDRQVEKSFKKVFNDASSIVQEQSIKIFKKHPKASVRNITLVTLMLELANCVVSNERTLLLTQECLDYLKSMDVLDQYVNVPPAIDEATYAIICKHRRIKIEVELRIKASALEMAEAENTIQTFQKLLITKKLHGQFLLADLDQVREDRFEMMHNIEMQLVFKRGVVELPTSGRTIDFDDAVMVSRKDVETINKIILRGGNAKIKAMKETMTFRRGIIAMEWQHTCLRMQIADLHTYVEDIESIKVTKEIQSYLKGKARGYSAENLSFEEEVEIVKASYMKIIDEKRNKIKELQKKINQIKKQSSRSGAEPSLDELINSANIDVCEFQLQRDHALEKREKNIIKTRMATLVKRAQLIKQIQKNHSEILVLQTELELKRLKKYPTLAYKILP